MPVGNLFVIPRDFRAFAASVELRLHRNGELRQSARQSEAIWDFDEMLRQTKKRAAASWDHEGRTVKLAVKDGHIPARTALLGGTPEGTIFRGVNRSAIVLGLWDLLTGGWRQPLSHWIVERQIAQELAARNYLQPGERVQIAVDYLGEIDSRIVE